jgi:hypothetical protein
MATPSFKIDEHRVSLRADKIVRRLDDFPELVRALRDGDLLTGRSFCARLFDGDARRNHLGELTPSLRAAMKEF